MSLLLSDLRNNTKKIKYIFRSRFRYALCSQYDIKTEWCRQMLLRLNQTGTYPVQKKLSRSSKRNLETFFKTYKEEDWCDLEQYKLDWEKYRGTPLCSKEDIEILHFILRDQFICGEYDKMIYNKTYDLERKITSNNFKVRNVYDTFRKNIFLFSENDEIYTGVQQTYKQLRTLYRKSLSLETKNEKVF